MGCRGVLDQGRSKDAESVNKARAILTENAKGAGIDGEMVDEAVSRKARRILAAAELEMAVYPSGPRAGQCGAEAGRDAVGAAPQTRLSLQNSELIDAVGTADGVLYAYRVQARLEQL
jgi:hypothetical protein